MAHRVTFAYDIRGRGWLRVYSQDVEEWAEPCRTGSIDGDGQLINGLAEGRWYLCDVPVDTDEYAMIWHGESVGWKCRLYRYLVEGDIYQPTHFLVHPDGGKGGTLGCIGVLTNGKGLRGILRSAIEADKPKMVPLDVWKAT